MTDETQAIEAEEPAHCFQIVDMVAKRDQRVVERGARPPAAALIIEDEGVRTRERQKIVAQIRHAEPRPAMHHHDRWPLAVDAVVETLPVRGRDEPFSGRADRGVGAGHGAT